MELRHVADREGRLLSFLRGELNMSVGLVNRLKRQQVICVNGKPEWNDFLVKPGDVITVALEEAEPEYPPEDGELTILYEDAHILAVDKPAGMLIHPSRHRDRGTLANLVAGYFQKTGQKSVFHPLTRLDRDTFGVVLLAKNAHIHALLNEIHNLGQIRKTYHGLTFGGPETGEGRIDLSIARKELPSLLREVRADGKPSVTEYRLLERRDGCCLLELRPVTGRTHQLRVHCAHMGWPILADPQYGTQQSLDYSRRFGLETQQLCARQLELPHPITGEPLILQSCLDVSAEAGKREPGEER